jgi:poly [ADP-ribose] polymerase 10/14/15
MAAKNYKSIALPAISSGVFGCPLDDCAEVMVSVAIEFCKSPGSSTLDEINIVLFKHSDIPHFVTALRAHLPPKNIHRLQGNSSYTQCSAQPGNPTQSPLLPSQKEKGEIKEGETTSSRNPSSLSRVLVKQGSILDVKAEIYVNSTNGNMDLSGGAVSQALVKAAGPSLQAECTQKAPIAAGEIAVTKPGNIQQCNCVIHINCPGYDESDRQAEEVLRTIMNKCMKECEAQGARTIAFPAIGTGNLRFPVATAAHIMVDEVCNYLQKNECRALSNVYFIIFMEKMYRTFCDELEKRMKVESVPVVREARPEGLLHVYLGHKHATPETPQSKLREEGAAAKPSGSHSLDLKNGITVEIVKGDITLEKTDAIVNTTDLRLSFTSGVSLALGKKGGKSLREACIAVDKTGLTEGKVIDTEPGNLLCKRVFHMVFQRRNFVEVVSACVERALELKYKSIAFPAIGTGKERYPADEAAKDMIKGIQRCKTSSQLQLRIVLFQEEVYSKFVEVIEGLQASFPRGEATVVGSSPVYVGRKVPTYENEPADEVANIELRIFGETQGCVKSAESKIRELIKKQFKTETMNIKSIHLLKESQERFLVRKAREKQLAFCVDRKSNTIQLKGNKDSIAEMKLEIQTALGRVEKAETVMKTVQWKRLGPTVTSYDSLMNLEIEEMFESKPSHTFKDDVSKEHFTIDFKTMEEIDHAMRDKRCKVKRFKIGKCNDHEPQLEPN